MLHIFFKNIDVWKNETSLKLKKSLIEQSNTTTASVSSSDFDRSDNDESENVEDENNGDDDVEEESESDDQTTETPSVNNNLPTTAETTTATPAILGSNVTVRTFVQSPAVQSSTVRPTKLDELTVQRKKVAEQQKARNPTPNDLSTEESSSQGVVSIIETTLCDCPEIEVTSKVIWVEQQTSLATVFVFIKYKPLNVISFCY